MTQGNVPPGWYDDGSGTQRWWDGQQWTESLAPATPQTPAGGTEYLQPGYGQPAGYGQQPGYPGGYPGGPGGPRKSKGPLFAVLGVVALLVIGGIVALILVLGGDDGGDSTAADGPSHSYSSGSDPKATVEAFIDAAKKGDCDAAEKLVTQHFLDQVGSDCNQGQTDNGGVDFRLDATGDFTFDVGDADESGDQATVPVAITDSSEGTGVPVTVDYQLIKQGDGWLIDDFELHGVPDLPTATATDFPTDFLTDFLTDFPTDFLTDLPTDFLSDFPTQ